MKRLALALIVAAFASVAVAQTPEPSQQVTLINAVTATTVGTAVAMGKTRSATTGVGLIPNVPHRTFHASGTVSTSTGAATIKVQVSAGGAAYIDACTITLTLGTAATADGCAMAAGWPYVRGNVTAISGTNATVSLFMGL